MSEGLKSITVKFLGDVVGLAGAADVAQKELEKVAGAAEKGVSSWDKFSKAAGIAGLAIAGGLLEGLKAGIDNMNELNNSNVALGSVLANMPDQFGLTTKALDEQADAFQSVTTFSRDQILAADQVILKNTAVTGAIKAGIFTQKDATQAVLDLAQATGTDAPTAAARFSKALSQPFSATKVLTAAGVVLTQQQQDQIAGFKKTGDVADAQRLIYGALTDKLKGTADAAGKTLPAKLEQAKRAFGDAEGELTVALVPALSTVVGWFTKIADWAQKNPAQFKVVVGVLASLAGVLLAIGAAVKIWTAAQALWNGVMAITNFLLDANPIVLIAIGIGLFIAAVIIAYNKSATFRSIVVGAFNAVKDAAEVCWNWVKNNWPLLAGLVFGPFGLVIGELVKHFNQVEQVAKDVFSAIKTAYDHSGISTIISGIGKIGGALGKVGGAIAGAFADGGNVGTTGSYLVGENGPEVVNLKGGSSVVPNHQLGNGGGAMTVHIHATGPTLADIVKVELGKSTRATKNAVRAGSSRAFV